MNLNSTAANYSLSKPEETIRHYREGVQDIYGGGRSTTCHSAWNLLVLRHFGYAVDLLREIRLANFAAANLHFSFVKWGSVDAEWFHVLSNALPTAIFLNSDKELEELVKWFTLATEPEYSGPNGPDLAKVYLLVANHLKSNHSREANSLLLRQLCLSKKKRARLSAELFQAAIEGSQSEYSSALSASLKQIKSTRRPPLDCTFPAEWVGTEQSLIHEIARREGKSFVQLPSDLSCFLVTRFTMGIDE